METQELEKILEKLKGLDIQRWTYTHEHVFNGDFLITETNGLRLSIIKQGYKGRVDDTLKYLMFIENAEDGINTLSFIEHSFDKKNKPQREMLDKFYEKTLAALKEYKEKEIKKKLNDFILD